MSGAALGNNTTNARYGDPCPPAADPAAPRITAHIGYQPGFKLVDANTSMQHSICGVEAGLGRPPSMA